MLVWKYIRILVVKFTLPSPLFTSCKFVISSTELGEVACFDLVTLARAYLVPSAMKEVMIA